MKKIALILACIMVLAAFVGCNNTPASTTPSTPKPTTPTEPNDEPEIEYIDIYFDDRKSISEVFGGVVNEFEIVSQEVTSKIVGTDEADEQLVIYDKNTYRLTAVGTGTAVVKVNGEEKHLRVNPAPITLAIITGHSIGAGSKGNLTDSVVCEAGQAYNTTLTIQNNSAWKTDMRGSTLGFAESDRVINIDCITGDAGSVKGARGVNSAFAYKWNELTGEKIWVVNCAVGGSCINQWQPDAKSKYHEYSLGAINLASEILKGEVEAGHYEYRMTVMINFSSANFIHQNVTYDDELLEKWHNDMWQGYVDGVTVDIDGDGKNDAPSHLGYAPIWTPTLTSFDRDYHLVYYRSASIEYPHVFLASEFTRHWKTDADVNATFPGIKYKTQGGKTLTRPGRINQIFDEDGTHLLQIGYNAVGMQIAENLYNHLFGEKRVKSVTLYETSADIKGIEIGDTMTMKNGQQYKFLLITDPSGVSDYTIELSKNLTLDSFFYVTAIARGTGTITIKRGDEVVKTVTVTVE